MILREAIIHEVNSDYAYAVSEKDLIIKIRTKKNDLDSVNLLYADKYKFLSNQSSLYKTEMIKVAQDSLFDYYEIQVEVKMISVCYAFELTQKSEKLYYGNYNFCEAYPGITDNLFIKPLLSEKEVFHTPEWAKKSIVYQIFPERFFNGDHSLSPKNVESWNSSPTIKTMLGGDLKGIIEKLPYLSELGINVIYLTPIFLSSSNHKYNTYDYFKIDPQFGTLDTLKELVQKAHERNMKIVLDAVFNHSGTEFAPFKDVLENGEASKYKDWFDIRKFPFEIKEDPDYNTFAYHGHMPKLMTKNESVANYLIDVAAYWIKEADIDGWRLDVADEIDQFFWRRFRESVKKVKEDAFIVGEVWYDSRPWLKGDQFDSTMNYLFRNSVEGFITQESITSQEFFDKLGFVRGNYKKEAYEVLWNLIDSHDTSRFLYDAKEDKSKLKLAVLFQMTYTGIPMIYYGDEIGMTGGPDPDCRRGMIWEEEKQDKELFEYYKRLISIRKDNMALLKGDFKPIYIDNDRKMIGYRRELAEETIDIYINNGNEESFVEFERNSVVELISGKVYNNYGSSVVIKIPPKSGIIIK